MVGRLLVFMSYYSQQFKQIRIGKSQGDGTVAVFIFNENLLSLPIAQAPLFDGQKTSFISLKWYTFCLKLKKCPRTISHVSIMN